MASFVSQSLLSQASDSTDAAKKDDKFEEPLGLVTTSMVLTIPLLPLGALIGSIIDENTLSGADIPNIYEVRTLQQYDSLLDKIAKKKDKKNFSTLAIEFYETTITNSAISEKTAQELFTKFNQNIGNFSDITGLETPDFSDLKLCRSRVEKDFRETSVSSYKMAEKINACTQEFNGSTFKKSSLFVSLVLTFLIAGAIQHQQYSSGQTIKNNKLSRKLGHNH